MISVTWVLKDGRRISADVTGSQNLMEAGLQNNVPGIIAECGGNLSCATCHVRVDEGWIARAGAATGSELDMLDATMEPSTAASRLSCQIKVSSDLDGLVLHVP